MPIMILDLSSVIYILFGAEFNLIISLELFVPVEGSQNLMELS